MAAKVTSTQGYTGIEGNTVYFDQNYSPFVGPKSKPIPETLWALAPQLAAFDPAVAYTYADDFAVYDDTATVGRYAEVSDGGTIATTDAQSGVLSIATGGTDNDEAYVSSMHEVFKFADDKPLWFEARVKLTEAATNAANIIVGLSDTVGADTLLDDGAGPAASYDGVVFAKLDGASVWQFETSNAGTQSTTANLGAFDDGEWTRIGFEFDPKDGTTGSVTPYLNGIAGTALDITLSGLEEMHVLMGVKAGSANAETLLVDYVKAMQIR